MKKLLLILALLVTPVIKAETPPIVTATDAVMYAAGGIDAQVDVSQSLALPPDQRISFRAMASNNVLTANLLWSNGYIAVALYFYGRAYVFSLAADTAGEP